MASARRTVVSLERATIDASHERSSPSTGSSSTGSACSWAARVDAAEAVCGDGLDVLEAVSSLIDNSLVRLVGRGAEGRYAMLHVTSVYALERLADRPDAVGRPGPIPRVAQFSERLGPSLRLGVIEPASVEHLFADSDDLRFALNRASKSGTANVQMRMVAGLGSTGRRAGLRPRVDVNSA